MGRFELRVGHRHGMAWDLPGEARCHAQDVEAHIGSIVTADRHTQSCGPGVPNAAYSPSQTPFLHTTHTSARCIRPMVWYSSEWPHTDGHTLTAAHLVRALAKAHSVQQNA